MSTLYLFAPGTAHTRAGHPENAERAEAIRQVLEEMAVLPRLQSIMARPADVTQLTRVHRLGMIEHVRRGAMLGGGMLDGDTYVTPESYDLALAAAGGCCLMVDKIMSGAGRNGLAVVRPPGHHAETGQVGGFCLFNNVAAAARQAQAVHGVERVLILDFDVHHGNGTQEIFYEDPSVLFVSTHLFYHFFYPGSGDMNETGSGPGKGFTLNVPLPPHVGDRGYAQVMSEIVWPRVRDFQPELILVSAGFDAHWQDPLAFANLSLTGYAHLSRELVKMADTFCDGRIMFVLEGGYMVYALAYGVLNTIYALLGDDQILDPLGPSPEAETDVSPLLQRLAGLHLIK